MTGAHGELSHGTPAKRVQAWRRGQASTGCSLRRPSGCVQATEAFVEQLAAKHAGDCPWRATACAPELAAFPPLPSDAVRMPF